jgi:ATP-dependent helicase/nuclease subunit B
MKFADIALIFTEYLKAVEDKYIDPDIQLERICQAVGKAEFLSGARLWVDGFSGFTTAEMAILAEVLRTVAEAKIALCLDPSKVNLTRPDIGRLDMLGLFSPTEQTYTALFEIVKKCKLELAQPVTLSEAVRYSCAEPLAHLERNLFAGGAAKISAQDSIRIVSAPSARAEIRLVARQILELVKERDYRYRDIAVIASDIGRYEHYIRAYFEDYGIPFFIDVRKPLSRHPLVELVCSALQIVTGGFSHSDVFSYLKTDLVPVSRSDVDLLENYCLAFGIAGADWQSDKDWQFAAEPSQFDEQHINRVRRHLSEPLLRLQKGLCPPDNDRAIGPSEFTETLFDFLESLQVRQRIGP